MKRKDVARAFRVKDGDGFRLSRIDPAETLGFKSKEEVAETVTRGVERLAALQEKLYAHDRWAVLLVFQALDAAGKDSTIKHVMSGVNPQGCQVYSFKAPSNEDLDHDFFWRAAKCLPERGRIGIFNRSYYEEVLVVRVHQEFLAKQHLPARLAGRNVWRQRFESINDHERHLVRNGTLVLKFFLHVSPDEQRRRFLARLEEPSKNWKFNAGDLAERDRWDEYMHAYEEMIQRTATRHAPWFVVPADHKWFTRLVVVESIIDALEGLDLAYPALSADQRTAMKAAKAALERE
jgi:PPK2 family polyphosphate:nucleotide phosphotransferase